MNIRKITEDELNEFVLMSKYAFEDWNDKEVEKEYLKWHYPEHCFALFKENKMVSGMINHHLIQYVRNVRKKISGIGNVTTYPEHRNKGYIKQLFDFVFNDALLNDQSLSFLQPFKESYYENFGYVGLNREMRMEVDISAFSQYINVNHNFNLQRGKDDNIIKEFCELYSKFIKQYNGSITYEDFSFDGIKLKFKDSLILRVQDNRKTVAGMLYQKKDGKLNIFDIFWNNDLQRDAIFNFIATHRNQVGKIKMVLPFGTNFYKWFKDTNDKIMVTQIAGPWMGRIIEIKSALEGINIEKSGECFIKISDEYCKWNNGIFKLFNANHILRVEKDTHEEFDIEMDIKALTALLYGAYSTDELLYKKWIVSGHKNKLTLLDNWFKPMPFFNNFGF